jgi:hypothetical protein
MPKEPGCEDCGLRLRYDNKPKSLAGRFWRWHINWCPGWKAYFTSLPEDKKTELADKYNFRKYS